MKKQLKARIENIKLNNPNRIEKNENYIFNNYDSIKYEVENNIGSSMESHISHCIANMFSSRPKGYSSKNINKYLEINDYKNNSINIFDLYLKTYENTEQKELNKEQISFSIFERKSSNMPIINSTKKYKSQKLFNIIKGYISLSTTMYLSISPL